MDILGKVGILLYLVSALYPPPSLLLLVAFLPIGLLLFLSHREALEVDHQAMRDRPSKFLPLWHAQTVVVLLACLLAVERI